jgi:hypothetical protein
MVAHSVEMVVAIANKKVEVDDVADRLQAHAVTADEGS